jgi:hypothetical protein
LQEYVSSVSNVSAICFVCVFRTYVAIVFIWTLHMFHTYVLHVFYSDVAYGYNGFQVCFRCVFQVFYKHVSSVLTASDVCSNRCI